MIAIHTAAVAATTGDTICLCVVYSHFPPDFRSCPFYTCIYHTHTHRVQLVVGRLWSLVFQQIKAPNYCCFIALILNKLKFAYLSGGCLWLISMHACDIPASYTHRVYVAYDIRVYQLCSCSHDKFIFIQWISIFVRIQIDCMQTKKTVLWHIVHSSTGF